MTLFEMSAAARELLALLEAGEIDEQTVEDTMESIGASEKLEAYIHVQRQLESEIAGFSAEIERMKARKDSLEKQVARLKKAQAEFMRATGQKSAKAGTFSLSLRENKSVCITDEAAIPEQFIKARTTLQPDKKALMDALKSGAAITGAHIESSFSVTVK